MKVCYWNEIEGVQQERDMTVAEVAQREIDIAASVAEKAAMKPVYSLENVVSALMNKGILTAKDLE